MNFAKRKKFGVKINAKMAVIAFLMRLLVIIPANVLWDTTDGFVPKNLYHVRRILVRMVDLVR